MALCCGGGVLCTLLSHTVHSVEQAVMANQSKGWLCQQWRRPLERPLLLLAASKGFSDHVTAAATAAAAVHAKAIKTTANRCRSEDWYFRSG